MRDIRDVAEGFVSDILNSMNAGVYMTDTDRRIVFWNRHAEEITGYAAEEVVGSRCHDDILVHHNKEGRPLCTTDLCPLYRSIVTDQRTPRPVIVYAKTASGERVPLSTSCAPVHDDDGNVIGGIEVFRDERESEMQMELARAAHAQMLVSDRPTDERISFDVHYVPAEMIGGDFYHTTQVSDDLYFLFLADVSGHGISAALYIALLHSLVYECGEAMGDPARFMSQLSVRIQSRTPQIGFVTAVSATLDAAARTLRFCSAGHPSALLQRASDGGIEELHSTGYPLGIEAGAGYGVREARLEEGDRFLAYTDGVIEIRVDRDKLLGTPGLIELLAGVPPEGEDHRLTQLYDCVLRRCAVPVPDDDIALLSCMLF